MTTPSAPVSPRPRRLVPPSWFDLRLVLGVALVLGCVLLGARLLSAARHTEPVVAATHDLEAGTILQSNDLALVQVQIPSRERYLPRVEAAVGRRLRNPITAGQLLPAASITGAPAQTSITVGLSAGAAPTLHRGQRIKLWLSAPSCAAFTLLPDVTVQGVQVDSGSSLRAGTGGQDVVLDVPPEVADQVVKALAIADVQLRAGVLTGGDGGQPQPVGQPSADVSSAKVAMQPSAQPPTSSDLSACLKPARSR